MAGLGTAQTVHSRPGQRLGPHGQRVQGPPPSTGEDRRGAVLPAAVQPGVERHRAGLAAGEVRGLPTTQPDQHRLPRPGRRPGNDPATRPNPRTSKKLHPSRLARDISQHVQHCTQAGTLAIHLAPPASTTSAKRVAVAAERGFPREMAVVESAGGPGRPAGDRAPSPVPPVEGARVQPPYHPLCGWTCRGLSVSGAGVCGYLSSR